MNAILNENEALKSQLAQLMEELRRYREQYEKDRVTIGMLTQVFL